jgi:hypothetical protein
MSTLNLDDEDDTNGMAPPPPEKLFVGLEARAYYFDLYRSMSTDHGGVVLSKKQMQQQFPTKDARVLYLELCEKQKMTPNPMGLIRKEEQPTTANLR